MQEIFFDHNLGYFFLVIIALLLFVHAYVLMRIRHILQVMSLKFDTVIYFCRKIAPAHSTVKKGSKLPKTCQYCKHRLAYINTSKTRDEEEDFYHMCGLRNVYISLNDSCEKFEVDNEMAQ